MALTVSNIMERARERYNATGDEFFTDQMLRALIFSAQEELSKEGWVIETTYTTTSTSGTRELSYPSNTLAIKEIRYDYEKIRKVPLRNDPKTSSTNPEGEPREYAIWNDIIILYPTPDTTGDTIQIRVYSYPSDITSNVSPLEVPQEYRDDLINYCIAHMALKDQNVPIYREYISEWKMAVEKAKEQRQRRLRSDRPAKVRDEYFGSDFPISEQEIIYGGFRF